MLMCLFWAARLALTRNVRGPLRGYVPRVGRKAIAVAALAEMKQRCVHRQAPVKAGDLPGPTPPTRHSWCPSAALERPWIVYGRRRAMGQECLCQEAAMQQLWYGMTLA